MYLLCGAVFMVALGSCSTEVPDITDGLDKDGANVCYFTETASKSTIQSHNDIVTTMEIRKTCCWWNCINPTCYSKKLKTKHLRRYRAVTKYLDRKNYHCCSGWARENRTESQCSKAICSISCKNGGKCVEPDTCQCEEGFSGKYCQTDVDECKDARYNDCEQNCINLKAGYKCFCDKGYLLNKNGKTCDDIDECNDHTTACGCVIDDGVCQSHCNNSIGSYKCTCNKGYALKGMTKCEDVNECLVDSKLCDQRCVNKKGSYKCDCFEGFKYDGKKCVDVDECSIDNGGCNGTCHNTLGAHFCSCPKDYILEKDRRSCKKIDLTTKSETICKNDSYIILSCKGRKKVEILNVMYGRLSKEDCPFGNYTQNLFCISADNSIQERIGKACDSYSCFFFLNELLKPVQDPCPGISKYMKIHYKCV